MMKSIQENNRIKPAIQLLRDWATAEKALSKSAFVIAALIISPIGHAYDVGPFKLTGFLKGEWGQGNSQCDPSNCALYPNEGKQRIWADEVVPGKTYGTESNHVTLFQPWLAANFDLGHGYKLSGLLSQRWRDGKIDIPGFVYERNIALSHEEYGSLRIGAMTTRAWSIADYPYGTDVGLADFWGGSGAGYGLLNNAVRYTSRILDFAEGDLVLEVTYDFGNRKFKKNKPRFWEIYAQYHRDDLAVDVMFQDTRNGVPSAWGHGPFYEPTHRTSDDSKLGGSGQSILLAMASFQLNPKTKIYGGIRHNRWSGAYAVLTQDPVYNHRGDLLTPGLWNNMFNVDWNGSKDGVSNPGYSARSTDFMLGATYRQNKWTGSVGLGHLGRAQTGNPSERGQSNSATVTTAGINYNFRNGAQVYLSLANVQYGKLGLSPLSMPGNSAFTNVDSRVRRSGSWFVLGSVYVF